jgi:cell division protein FtsB
MKKLKNIFGIAIIIFLFFSLTKNIADYQATVTTYKQYKAEYEKTKHEQIQLKTNIIKSRDSYEQEKIMRNQLGLEKPGETTIIVPLPTPTPPPPTPTPAPPFMQWYRLFFR